MTYEPVKKHLRLEEQLDLWLAGFPVHNLAGFDKNGDCCPDFSCCDLQLLAPLKVRIAFATAYYMSNQQLMWKYMSGFMVKMLKANDIPEPYVTGRIEE